MVLKHQRWYWCKLITKLEKCSLVVRVHWVHLIFSYRCYFSLRWIGIGVCELCSWIIFDLFVTND